MTTFNLCPGGHLSTFPDLDGIPFPTFHERRERDRFCRTCGEQFVWEGTKMPEVVEPPVREMCNLGEMHVLSPAVHKIPEEGRIEIRAPHWECQPGWASLINPLIEECKRLQVPINQIKEKFGGLRFYIGSSSNASADDYAKLQRMIDEAENTSFTVCEVCGERGVTTRSGWRKTLCPTHTKEWEAR